MRRHLFPVVLLLGLLGFIPGGRAQDYTPPDSRLDPSIMQIDEHKFLGARMDPATVLVGADGHEFTLGSMLGQPLILLLSYYTCDGSCSIINNQLAELMPDVTRVKAGSDYRMLTLSFDQHDTLETTGAFQAHVETAASFGDNWRFATFKNENDLKAQTAKIGFKFFWSPSDRVFLHPGAFLFLTAEGRLARVLYPPNVNARDVELAVLDAKAENFRPSEVLNLAYSLCYSYNFKEGRYTMNIPMFVGFGALGFGIVALGAAIFSFKRTKREGSHAQFT